jgi:hypothetical protein
MGNGLSARSDCLLPILFLYDVARPLRLGKLWSGKSGQITEISPLLLEGVALLPD